MKRILLTTLVVVLSTGYAQADTKQDIIARCKNQMADYGAAIVKACVDQDIEAYNALSGYDDKYKKILNRCINSMDGYGWAIVKACADQDIEAEKALSEY